MSTLKKILAAIEAAESERITTANVMCQDVITISSENKVVDAIRLMEKHSISQLPVLDQDNRIVGSIQESTIVKELLIENSDIIFEEKIKDVMEDSFPIVGLEERIENIYPIIARGTPAVLVVDRGKLMGIVCKIDLLRKISTQKNGWNDKKHISTK